jgi:hypothetical protein
MTGLSYPVNTRYTATGLLLISSHSAPKEKKTKAKDIVKGIAIIFAGSILVGVLIGMSDAIKPQFMDSIYHRMGDDETGIDVKNYADSGYEGVLYEPFLSALYPISDGPLWVWVPLPERELSLMLEGCSQPEVDNLPRSEERKAKRKRLIACAGAYVELYLDEQPIDLPTAIREYRATEAADEQFGVRFDLSARSPTPGRHTLKVVTHYPLETDEGEKFRTTYITFFMMKDGNSKPVEL